MHSIIYFVVLLGVVTVPTLSQPVNVTHSEDQLVKTMGIAVNATQLIQSTQISPKAITTEATLTASKERSVHANSTFITTEDPMQNNSTADAEPRPQMIGTRLSATLLKILTQMG
ncbi:hypothetical protein KR222_010742 [Zaprionus bogoriensis]|nr:hypothetical protein KR222_010742 [Zaprionus bogoriensis]